MDNARVLGWGMPRAFGNAAYIWSRKIQELLHEEFLGERVHTSRRHRTYC
jgi:pyruvate dehydrogenase phosphatase